MKRRKFIVQGAKALPLLMLYSQLATACEEEEPVTPNGKKVIVIGSGIAGLAAARELQAGGFEVVILEARDKAGGRIRTDRSLGLAFDEGASWIHRPNGNPITPLAAAAAAITYRTDDEQVTVYDITGSAYTDSALDTAETQFEEALEAVRNGGSADVSFDSRFRQLFPDRADNRLWKYMLSAYLEFSTGGDISRLSSLQFDDDEEFRGEDVLITNGYDHITDYLAQSLDVRLSTPVETIEYSGVKVTVSSQGSVHEADYVVVTVPLGVLKAGHIDFSPALPASKLAAIGRCGMGNVNKFLLLWDNAFWDNSLQYIGITPETKGKFNYFLNLRKFSPHNALMTFALGDYASATEQMSDEEVTESILQHLRLLYGNNLPQPLAMLRTRWGQEPFSLGAYSFVAKGSESSDFDRLSASVDDRLFFAGEHTSRLYRGTVHGAYLSGLREAEKIIALQ
jgi:monoamine oxidase